MKKAEKAKRKLFNTIGKISNKIAQNENAFAEKSSDSSSEEMRAALRAAGAEGTVLLKNDGVLPLDKDEALSVFGRCQLDWFYVGYGSGGDVNRAYEINMIDGIMNAGGALSTELLSFYEAWCRKNPADHGFWGHWPYCYPEPELDCAFIKNAAVKSKTAAVVIGRAAGEDRENTLEEGSFYLTEQEKKLLCEVTEHFEKTVVILNIGNIIDFPPILDCCRGKTALLCAWQCGSESGNALADVLYGKVSPGGRLSMTAAKRYSDYPAAVNFGGKEFNEYKEDIFVGYRFFETFRKEAVLYPFGFGLSYAEFKKEVININADENIIEAEIKITNTSPDFCGSELAAVYCSQPQGALGKPARVLCGYKKTDVLQPGESETVKISFPLYLISSFDDTGESGFPFSYILEKGEYTLFLGGDVRSAEKIHSFTLPETKVIKTLSEVCGVKEPFLRLRAKGTNTGTAVPFYEKTPVTKRNLKEDILGCLPTEIPFTGDRGFKLCDVKSGRCTLDEFTAQLSCTELEALSRGDYTMNSPLGAPGNAGALGGVLPSLRDKGIAPVITTDGPSGIRLKACCSLLPSGTALACSWNTELVFRLYAMLGQEMMERGSDILLAPGMNIQRNPLCGRNFEYYSEDPILTGETAAAAVSGIQSAGVSACPKHFACNNQETNRTHNDSRVSERALREVYLKGFEICVEKSKPLCLMTSYNKVNGVWSHYNYALCTDILRKEWGYDGLVITDWWMRKSKSPEFPDLRDNAYRVRAQVDVLMPGGSRSGRKKPDGTLLESLGKDGGITPGELQRTAKNVLKLVMKIK